MPSLSDNGFNRYIYRDTSNYDTSDVSTSAYQDIAGSQNSNANPGGGSTGNSTTPSNGLQPGSQPVQGVLLQTSGSDYRVELNPDDHLYAYNDGDVVVTIGKDGIDADNIVARDHTTDNLNVMDLFTYDGINQPVVFSGEVLGSSGTFVTAPAGWTIVKNGTGDYTITHNLNTDPTYLICSPRSGHFRYQIDAITANYVRVTWEETSYGSVTVGVSGGGGGSVTVPGVRIAPGEVPVDVSFQFILLQPRF